MSTSFGDTGKNALGMVLRGGYVGVGGEVKKDRTKTKKGFAEISRGCASLSSITEIPSLPCSDLLVDAFHQKLGSEISLCVRSLWL